MSVRSHVISISFSPHACLRFAFSLLSSVRFGVCLFVSYIFVILVIFVYVFFLTVSKTVPMLVCIESQMPQKQYTCIYLYPSISVAAAVVVVVSVVSFSPTRIWRVLFCCCYCLLAW